MSLFSGGLAHVQTGYWQDLATTDFARIDPEQTVALLPVAAIEQHGPHLPLSTDAVINDGIVRAALERLPPRPAVLVLPALTVGTSAEHLSFAGTLSLTPDTLAAAWAQIGACVARAGVRKLVIFNTHGGQKTVVDQVALRLRAEHGMLVARASYFALGSPPGLFDAREAVHDIHGGEIETSLMLHLRPDLVRQDELRDFKGLPHELAARNTLLGAEKPIGIGWLSEDLHPAGVCGNAARADAKRGAEHLAWLADRLVTLLGEVAATPLAVLRT
ncbi:MAG TPA: creatininase family protein [Gammaproteobacteria bacterium]|nr:creatininase family protein [Gammaproteobacteria bacterium]